MGPEEIAAYVERLYAEFRKNNWGGDYTVEFIKIALREKLRFEAEKAAALKEWRTGGLSD